MASAFDCAVLSEDVYSREHNELARSEGWRRLDAQNWGSGFAAGTYAKDGDVVVAFRGTDDLQDVIADAHMIPAAPPDRIMRVIPALLSEYDLSDSIELQVGGALLGGMLVDWRSRVLVGTLANRVPELQVQQAAAYLRALPRMPDIVTGHSLGGALAKALCLEQGVACVAFNSPYMGNLRGIPPLCSGRLKSINTRGDPLSLATEEVGNLSLGEVILVAIPRFAEPPPLRPQMESYHRPAVCPRAGSGSGMLENLLIEYVAEPACEGALDVWEPVGRAVTAPRRALRHVFNAYPEYVQSLLGYLVRALLHYHSMEKLRVQMDSLSQFRSPLRF